jgi:glycosyltransferase involved in cell wall biosynthesis
VRALRVGIDGRAFTSPAAGVRRYVEGLVPALMAFDGALEIVALGGTESPTGVERVPEPAHPPTNFGWSVVGLPLAASRAKVDVIHAPAYTAPFWAAVPVVVTIHDVSYERHPEWYPYRRDWLRRAFYRRSARSAVHVLTDSAFSAEEIAQAYAIDRQQITVAPLGVTAAFSRAADHSAGVVTPFLLHVGDLHERRNLRMVVDALVEARRRPGAERLSLVLAGVDRGVGESLDQAAASAAAPDAVVRLGSVSEERLRALYRGAAALVYPSRYEGFGLPVLEAMASGTPVIASHAGSIPEVLGNAGVLLDPDDRPGWVAAIGAIMTDEVLARRLRQLGVSRAQTFTWARTAAITAGVYRRAAQR